MKNHAATLAIVLVVGSMMAAPFFGSGGSSRYDSDEMADQAAEAAINDYEPEGCTSDCSGHDAGHEWAESNGITDPADCNGNSDSFIEGCEQYAMTQQEAGESMEPAEYGRYAQ